MRRLRAIAIASVLLAMAGTARTDVPLTDVLAVLGSVTHSARPVANALIVALNLNSLEAFETFTISDGRFSLPPLRAGVYKIVALKRGFLPATAVVLPTRKDFHVALKLDAEKPNAKNANQEIWELRSTVPPDILRDIEMVMAPPQNAAAYDIPRIRGEMVSMTGVTADQSNNSVAFAQTALGVQSRLNGNWQIGFRGNLHRVDDPNEATPFSSSLAESSGVQMELRSSPTESYRLASTKSWWRYRDNADPDRAADVRSHNFEWEHGGAHLQVRYFAQQNVFQVNPLGSQLVEIAGNTTILQTRRSDIGVSMRVSQETLRNVASTTYRTADIAANASLEVVPSLVVRYGVASRLGLDGTELAPRTGAEVHISKDASLVVSGQYKALDQRRNVALPTTVMGSEEGNALPRYAYSFGIVAGDDATTNRFSAIATVTSVDAPLRVMITDGSEQFWDGVYVDSGDIRRDVRLAYRREIGRGMAIDVSTCAGMASPSRNGAIGGQKVYVTGDVQSTYTRTGTSVAISFRQIQQPQTAGADYRSERVSVRMAQSLHLPLDLKILLGLELAHAENSPFLLDTFDPEGTVARRYIGGLAVNF